VAENLGVERRGRFQEGGAGEFEGELNKGCAWRGVVPLSFPSSPSACEFVGMFRNDPLIKEWKKSMAAYRRKVDKDATDQINFVLAQTL